LYLIENSPILGKHKFNKNIIFWLEFFIKNERPLVILKTFIISISQLLYQLYVVAELSQSVQ